MTISRTITIFLVFLCTSYGSAWAHQDTLLELRDGRIIGLPEEFQPAYFDIEKKVLQIRDNEVALPPCVTSFFKKVPNHIFLITASWYHDFELIGPYIVLHIESKKRDYRYEFVFLMESLEPFRFNLAQDGPVKDFSLEAPALDDICKRTIIQRTTKVQHLTK